jgi:NADH dehydrogenase
VVNPTDYFLYRCYQVASGVLEPRRIAAALDIHAAGRPDRHRRGDSIDLAARRLSYVDPSAGTGELTYDRLVLAVGSVNKLLPIPGVSSTRTASRECQALHLRDHPCARSSWRTPSTIRWSAMPVRSWSSVQGTPGTEVAGRGNCSPSS